MAVLLLDRVAAHTRVAPRQELYAEAVVGSDRVRLQVALRLLFEDDPAASVVADRVVGDASFAALLDVDAALATLADRVARHLGVGSALHSDRRAIVLAEEILLDEAARILAQQHAAAAALDRVLPQSHLRRARLVGKHARDRHPVRRQRDQQAHRCIELLLLLELVGLLLLRLELGHLATHLDVNPCRALDVVRYEHALPLGAHEHAPPLVVAQRVRLEVGARALAQHDAVDVAVDVVVLHVAAGALSLDVEAGGVTAVDLVAPDVGDAVGTNRDADALVGEDLVVGEGELSQLRVAVGEAIRLVARPRDAAAAVHVDAAHAAAPDAVAFHVRDGVPLHLDVPVSVVVKVVVGVDALAKLVAEEAERLAAVELVMAHDGRTKVPHAHRGLAVCVDVVVFVEALARLVDPDAAHPLVVDGVAAHDRVGAFSHLQPVPVAVDLILQQRAARVIREQHARLAVGMDAVAR
mmetsp:Transcript_3074/g.7956  ORF Transcript_3074/g.7956 Transcript_3074/m.7956 type:complete len:468 (+) Transcript_3074:466-1869(+)